MIVRKYDQTEQYTEGKCTFRKYTTEAYTETIAISETKWNRRGDTNG